MGRVILTFVREDDCGSWGQWLLVNAIARLLLVSGALILRIFALSPYPSVWYLLLRSGFALSLLPLRFRSVLSASWPAQMLPPC